MSFVTRSLLRDGVVSTVAPLHAWCLFLDADVLPSKRFRLHPRHQLISELVLTRSAPTLERVTSCRSSNVQSHVLAETRVGTDRVVMLVAGTLDVSRMHDCAYPTRNALNRQAKSVGNLVAGFAVGFPGGPSLEKLGRVGTARCKPANNMHIVQRQGVARCKRNQQTVIGVAGILTVSRTICVASLTASADTEDDARAKITANSPRINEHHDRFVHQARHSRALSFFTMLSDTCMFW